MATYEQLTARQKQGIADVDVLVRPLAGEIRRLAVKCRVAFSAWNAGPAGVIDGLDPGEKIPNSTGLSGAEEMTKEQFQTLLSYVEAFANHDSAAHLDVLRPAVGAVNIVGGQ